MIKVIGEKKPNQPLSALYKETDVPIKDGLFDPENKCTQLILWLYSMEPSFYADVSNASRNMSMSHLNNLGPLAYAMHLITKSTETNKPVKVDLGSELHNPENGLQHELGSWCSADLVFRAAHMRPEWIEEWRSSVGIKGLKNMATNEIAEGDEEKPAYIRM